jgi:hypothetical protein
MPNLSALEPLTTQATALAGLVLVSPQSTTGYQPQNPPNADGTPSERQQPPSFLFHYEGEQTSLLESDITDHFVESNLAIQDQIALKPEVVTTRGFIGELNDVVPTALKPLRFAADKLYSVVAFEPELTVTALLAYNNAKLLYDTASTVVDSAVSAWNSLTGGGGLSVINEQGITVENSQSKQQSAYQQLYGYWRSRTLFTVQTPWAVFQNMAIKSIRAIQDADTRMITDFELQFKMIRKASTQETLSQVSNLFQGRAGDQSASATDNGTSAPNDSTSLGDGLTQMGVA